MNIYCMFHRLTNKERIMQEKENQSRDSIKSSVKYKISLRNKYLYTDI